MNSIIFPETKSEEQMKQLLKTSSQNQTSCYRHDSVRNVQSNNPVHDTINVTNPPIVANEHLNLVDHTSPSTSNEDTSIQVQLSSQTCNEDDSENVKDGTALTQKDTQTQDKEKSYFNIFIEMIVG